MCPTDTSWGVRWAHIGVAPGKRTNRPLRRAKAQTGHSWYRTALWPAATTWWKILGRASAEVRGSVMLPGNPAQAGSAGGDRFHLPDQLTVRPRRQPCRRGGGRPGARGPALTPGPRPHTSLLHLEERILATALRRVARVAEDETAIQGGLGSSMDEVGENSVAHTTLLG